MEALFIVLAIPLTIFVLFVAPVWLWLHYNSQRRQGSVLQAQDSRRLVQLTEEAERMQARIRALEDILDAEHPNWRQ
ncbi:envelope stress response membrane protein PspB [Acerihabitans sp. TG2]|uniref:envelope stress response membrane protein PspB n=1 Tax=Acerihabitans sp. TG2 TaxID=3096008 RepID=UPI002B222FB2|nr:envelope stress response membrane protein PspB [Acerihabitans sp. TG2]MEA9389392.1 envelope stress response membrane protein PspB [Acerihabitans sp. TG2]